MVAAPATALILWMVAGLERARLLTEYEENHSKKKKESEQIPSVQKTFLSQTKNVTDVIEELDNPFADTSTDLYTLDSKLIIPDSVVHKDRRRHRQSTASDICCGATIYI